MFDPFKYCENGKKRHGRRSRHLENRVGPGNGVFLRLVLFLPGQAPRAYFSPLPISQPVRREDLRGLCGGERG